MLQNSTFSMNARDKGRDCIEPIAQASVWQHQQIFKFAQLEHQAERKCPEHPKKAVAKKLMRPSQALLQNRIYKRYYMIFLTRTT